VGGGAQLWPPPPCGVLFPALLLLMLVVGFGHRSRSSAARNAEGVAVRRFPLPQRQDVGMCGSVTARVRRGPAAVVSF